MTVSTNGMTIYQKGEFELVALDGKTVSLQTKVEQLAPPQAMSNPALPPGTEVQLEKYTGGGSGTVLLNLNGIIPSSEVTMDNQLVMSVNLGGNSQQMAVTTSMKLIVKPTK